VGEKPTAIKLHLTGPKSDLHEANPGQLAVKIDLSKAMPGKQTFSITNENVKLPKQVKLLDATPSSLTLSLVEIIQKDVLVKPQLVGKLPAGVRLKSIEVIPRKVRVLSPSSEGEEEGEEEVVLMTTPIYLENLRGSSRIFCKIIAPPGLQPNEKRWPDVEVYITVVPQ
jgi:YbbR domain-containing protein